MFASLELSSSEDESCRNEDVEVGCVSILDEIRLGKNISWTRWEWCLKVERDGQNKGSSAEMVWACKEEMRISPYKEV